MSLPLTSNASRLLLSHMAFMMIGPPSLPKPFEPSHSRWMTCTRVRHTRLHALPGTRAHLADAHGLHQTNCGFKLDVSLALDVDAQLRPVQAQLLQRGRRNNSACECGPHYAVEYVGIGINGRVANVKHVQRQAVFDSPGN